MNNRQKVERAVAVLAAVESKLREALQGNPVYGEKLVELHKLVYEAVQFFTRAEEPRVPMFVVRYGLRVIEHRGTRVRGLDCAEYRLVQAATITESHLFETVEKARAARDLAAPGGEVLRMHHYEEVGWQFVDIEAEESGQ